MGAQKKKVFIVSVPYLPFKHHLLERGWVENPDFFSPYFDLKYCVRMKDIDYKSLHPRQVISHFLGQNSVTNKFELSRSLINLVSQPQVDTARFFPRCYDLNCFYDHWNFLIDYKISFCVAFLKSNLARMHSRRVSEGVSGGLVFGEKEPHEIESLILKLLMSITCLLRYCDFLENKQNMRDIIKHSEFDYIRKKKIPEREIRWSQKVYADYIDHAIHKIKSQVHAAGPLRLADFVYVDSLAGSDQETQDAAQIQSEHVIDLQKHNEEDKPVESDPFISERVFAKPAKIENGEEPSSDKIANFEKQEGAVDIQIEENESNSNAQNELKEPAPEEEKEPKVDLESEQNGNAENNNSNLKGLMGDVVDLLMTHGVFTLSRVKALNPQYNLLDTHNLWILKPNGLSRGRGIRVFKNLEEIEAYWVAADSELVAMKYIERPFLIRKRKFDIRYWVVVTCLDPLCVWGFENYYIRLSLNDYDEQDSRNIYAHLTNNSVAKKNKELYSQIYAHSMLTKPQFLEYCRSQWAQFDADAFHAQMHRIVNLSLESGKFNMLPRKRSFSVFGFDLMVDTEFNIWLIEINSSPSMETNTNVTEKCVPEFFENLSHAMCDYNFVGNPNFDVGEEIKQLKLICKKFRGYNVM